MFDEDVVANKRASGVWLYKPCHVILNRLLTILKGYKGENINCNRDTGVNLSYDNQISYMEAKFDSIQPEIDVWHTQVTVSEE